MGAESTSHDPFQAIGESEAFITLQEQISRAARTDRSVIFIGERGTGKELAASRLHLLSQRWNQPYQTLNCAALNPSLIDSELFGHEAGAFTGAIRQRKGRFEMADGGSLFLDEAANIPLTVQEKILRVVEYGGLERVGGSKSLKVDVRLIAATNADLRQRAREGRFRQDLLDRLSFEVITLPPLSARKGDILLLAGYFARGMAAELDLSGSPVISPQAQRMLLEYPWPGNIRELKNVVERMVYRSEDGTIDAIVFDPFESAYAPREDHASSSDEKTIDLDGADPAILAPDRRGRRSHKKVEPAVEPAILAPRDSSLDESSSLPEAVRALEFQRIQEALEAERYNQRRAAERLGLTYNQFRGYYRKYRDELATN